MEGNHRLVVVASHHVVDGHGRVVVIAIARSEGPHTDRRRRRLVTSFWSLPPSCAPTTTHRTSRTLLARLATSRSPTLTGATRPSGEFRSRSWLDTRSEAHCTHATHSFIEYGSARDAEDAVRKLDGTDLVGAVVTVTADVSVVAVAFFGVRIRFTD